MTDRLWYALYGRACDGFQIKIGNQTITINTANETTEQNYLYFYKESNTVVKLISVSFFNQGTVQIRPFSGPKIEFINAQFVYSQSSDRPADPIDAAEAGKILVALDYSTQVLIMAGAALADLLPFSEWYKLNKTDARLVRIVELPYAPFQKKVDKNGKLNIPEGWTPEGALLKLTDPNIEFKDVIGSKTIQIPKLDINDFAPQHAPLGPAYEPKLYNSAFSSFKFVYDSNVYAFNPEENPTPWVSPYDATITFHYSTTLDNTLAFQFDTNLNQNQDYGEFLISNRSNSLPYYTNEYLNYLRYGKAIDEKQAGFNVASTAASSAATIATSAASVAAGVGLAAGKGSSLGIGGAIIGAIAGAVVSSISIARSARTSWDAMNNKIDQYTHQASNNRGTSDVSIFDVYGKNKLLYMTYEPREEFKNSLYDYFRYYGYACDEYGDIKQMYSRVYSDYFVVSPVFQDALLWNPFKEDIEDRLKLGIRVYHYKNGYDFQLTYENWEKELYDDWSN